MLTEMRAESTNCPCASLPLDLNACCGRYFAGSLHLLAPTAEALMRSRYSAFVLNRIDYLLATWHTNTRPIVLPAPEPGLKWLGLHVKNYAMQDATHATVEFIARSKLNGRAHRLHEISRFVREGVHWFYVDGNTNL
jgi:SEC-C motif domain protein